MRMYFTGMFLLLVFSALSQRQKQWGIHIAIPVFNEKLNEGRKYLPFQLSGTLQFKPILDTGKNNLSPFIEPQFVWVSYEPAHGNDFEFGVNAGLLYQCRIQQNLTLLATIGSGPHYISVESSQQTGGFIFSDNFGMGIKCKLNDGLYLMIAGRFRHMSNANLKKPNKGIDTWFILAGIYKKL